MTEKMCPCGKPLHYNDKSLEKMMDELVKKEGESIFVTVNGRTWAIPRHWIALHGLVAANIADLGFPEIASA